MFVWKSIRRMCVNREIVANPLIIHFKWREWKEILVNYCQWRRKSLRIGSSFQMGSRTNFEATLTLHSSKDLPLGTRSRGHRDVTDTRIPENDNPCVMVQWLKVRVRLSPVVAVWWSLQCVSDQKASYLSPHIDLSSGLFVCFDGCRRFVDQNIEFLKTIF
jgi:hypothetical protein